MKKVKNKQLMLIKRQKLMKNNGEKKEESKDGENKTEEVKEEEFRYKKDLLVKVSDLKEGTSREHFKEFFVAIGTQVAFVDFSRGHPTATIRLNDDSPIGAVDAAKKAKESELELGGKPAKEVTFAPIQDADEEAYWKNVTNQKQQLKDRGTKRKGRGGGRGGGGRGRGGGRRGGRGRGGGRRGGRGGGKKNKRQKGGE